MAVAETSELCSNGVELGAGWLSELSEEEAITALQSNLEKGLTTAIAGKLLLEIGANELESEPAIKWLELLRNQFASSVVLLLVASGAISFLMHEYFQAAAIIVAIMINAVVGFITEFRANTSLAQLREITGATIRSRRDGREVELPVSELVPGDIVLLEPGTRIPADLRIVESAALSVDQSALSGESVPVFKSSQAVEGGIDSPNLVFQGTSTVSGRAIGIVYATGLRTRLGSLGKLLTQTTKGETPLSIQLEQLGGQLTILTIATCALIAIIGIIHHESLSKMLQTSIALAVAAIPEGLPVIATLAMALGIRRMVEAKALVRNLPAVETLGCTTVICSDKTGTLTENRMVVTDIVLHDMHVKVEGNGYNPVGDLRLHNKPEGALELDSVKEFLRAAMLCNDARLEYHDKEGWHIHGDPTEGALITAANKVALDHAKEGKRYIRVLEIPFDLIRKRMTTVHAQPEGQFVCFTKGSPKSVLSICSHRYASGAKVLLTEQERQEIFRENQKLAEKGLRVLGVSTRKICDLPSSTELGALEQEHTFLGLIAMHDAPKGNVCDAIDQCHRAGIRVIMLTGDQSATAEAIAQRLNIIDGGETSNILLRGEDISSMTETQLTAAMKNARVLSRLSPEQKLTIVRHLQQQGEVVAMTGDGLNDAPALKQANIGIAMGENGTDLARESSDIVLTDDNFTTIVKAIEQGRTTYANIRRAVAYLLTASMASVMTVFLCVVTDTGLVLEPLQLLWLNLIMHIFPGLGFVLQKRSPDAMNDPPRDSSAPIVGRSETIQIALRSVFVSVAVIAACWLDHRVSAAAKDSTIALSTISIALLLQSWSWLRTKRPMFELTGTFDINWPMLAMTAIGVMLLLSALYLPGLARVLNTQPLSWTDFMIVWAMALASHFLSNACVFRQRTKA